MIEKNVEDNARNLVQTTVNRIETVLLSVQKIPESLACFLENSSYSREELLHILRVVVENNKEIYGSAIAFEPYGFDRKSQYFAPYYYKCDGLTEFTDLGKGSYRYLDWDWYQIPKELNRPDWSEPFFDVEGGNILMATYSVPFYRKGGGKREFMGIVTADVSLRWLEEVASSIKVLQTGYGFLISKNGTIVTHPLKNLIMNETLFGVAEAREDSGFREIGRKMIRGETGFVPFRSLVSEKQCWMYYTPIPANGWSLAVLFPQDEFMADINRLCRIVILLGIIGLSLLSIAIVLISRSITNPLRAMAKATEKIAIGNLDIELPPIKSQDEVGKLTSSFHYMKSSLKQYIQELTETTAAKERIESELKIAHDIQMSFLPKRFPPFPDRREFEIYATLEPAKEVGGDLYDFFLISDDHLFCSIGDVSGKGVPAALFMAVTKTLMKRIGEHMIDPSEVLARVNQELCLENDSTMFVTVFCGVLNLKTGEFRFSNAGHNPPLILRTGKNPEWLQVPEGLLMGVMEDTIYKTERVFLNPGDGILLYTDGVTEAMSKGKIAYSERKLMSTIKESKSGTPEELIREVMQSIKEFAEGEPPSDDITLLAFQFNGKKG